MALRPSLNLDFFGPAPSQPYSCSSDSDSHDISCGTRAGSWCGYWEGNHPEDSPEYHTWRGTILREHSVMPIGLGNDVYRTPTATNNLYPSIPAPQHILPSNHEPGTGTMEPNVVKDHMEETQAQEDSIALLLDAGEDNIIRLKSMIDKERKEYESLGEKLYEMFIIVTQNQQRELVELRKHAYDLQSNAKNVPLDQDWQELQRNLHDLRHKVNEYIELRTLQKLSSGGQTGKLAAIMNSLLGECLNIWNDLDALRQKFEEAKLSGGVNKPHGDDKHATIDWLDLHRYDLPPPCSSAADIVATYNAYSQLQRERISTRRNKVQRLLRDTRQELSLFRKDMEDEERWTTRMEEKLLFPGGDTKVPEVVCPTLSIASAMKQVALNYGAQELGKMAETVHKLESHFDNIDLRRLELGLKPTNPNFLAAGTSQTPTPTRTDITGEGKVVSYTAELESKLKGKHVDEEPQGTHLETMNKQLRDAKITATRNPFPKVDEALSAGASI
ncbi:hypothetical protein RRF57_012205 [Xylaria bambusicola]|uniref:Uncharacterized protein n=1 Tax=Xylaria bambusicola TaxID=326684 RepID=A0AAN7UW41_9PEZI